MNSSRLEQAHKRLLSALDTLESAFVGKGDGDYARSQVEELEARIISLQKERDAALAEKASLQDRYNDLAEAFEGLNSLICFALKSNSNFAVIKTLGDLGAGVDVVSEGEIRRALKCGIDASKIVFSGVGKTAEETRATNLQQEQFRRYKENRDYQQAQSAYKS